MFQYGHDELVEKNIGLQNIFIQWFCYTFAVVWDVDVVMV